MKGYGLTKTATENYTRSALSLEIDPVDLDLYAEQVELEKQMTQSGVIRYDRRRLRNVANHTESENAYGQSIIDQKTEVLAQAIGTAIAGINNGRAGRRAGAVTMLAGVDPRTVAYLSLKAILNGISTRAPQVRVMMNTAALVEDELRFRSLREQDAQMYTRLKLLAERRDRYAYKRKLVIHVANKEGVTWEPWSDTEKLHLGEWLLNRVMETIGLVEVTRHTEGRNRTVAYLQPTAETTAWISQKNAQAQLARPVYDPMIVPPVDWTGPTGGGYLTRYVRPVRLIKTSNRAYLEELSNTSMPIVYAAINAMQRTPWQVNADILSIMEQVWEVSADTGGLPRKYKLDLPPKPADIDTNEAARQKWKTEAARVHLDNLEMTSKLSQFRMALDTARRFRGYERIYFPYQLDFRSRVYAVPLLNPQGADWMKAMLRFANGKPLGDEGAKWLAIHLANCGDFKTPGGRKCSKARLEDRVQWVLDNEDMIFGCAADPLVNTQWSEADSPWQFLAACLEWVGYRRVGAGFISRLPVALDGSCSGIQNYSAALRDEIGGAAVNLIPSDEPQDIYQKVADAVVEMAKADLGDPKWGEVARQWLTFGITRSVTKRPVMTMPYGSRGYGFREQIMQDTLGPAYREFQRWEKGLEDAGCPPTEEQKAARWPFADNGFAASLYMAQRIERGVERVVVKAAEAMKWLKQATALAASEGLPVNWTTPVGFPVQQAYYDTSRRRVETMIAGKRTVLDLPVDLDTIDKKAQAQAIAPNFVHSLDASHLMLTVVRGMEEGVTSFALIHDSFGTLAADSPRFFQIVREAFVEMYEAVDVVAAFRDDLLRHLPEQAQRDLPQPPLRGALDLSVVVESSYCFA